MNDEDDPTLWRSTVDPTSGRTYWYHRITRISTWTMPACLETGSSADEFLLQDNKETVEIEDSFLAKSVISSAINDCADFIDDEFNECLEESHVDDAIETANGLTDGSGGDTYTDEQDTPSSGKFHNRPPSAPNVEQLNRRSSVTSLFDQVKESTSQVHRHAALLGVLAVSLDRQASADVFPADLTWLNLHLSVPQWDDTESVLLLTAVHCNLLIGRATNQLCPPETLASLLNHLEGVLYASASQSGVSHDHRQFDVGLFLHPRKDCGLAIAPLDERVVANYCALATRGHALPALFLVVLADEALRTESHALAVLERGFVAALQQVCICERLDKDIRARARSTVLRAMSCCADVRESVLDGLLGLAADLAAVPSTVGPDSATEGVAGRASPSCDSDVEGEMLRRAEDELAGLNDIAPAAHGAEAADDRAEADLPRDVDWIPTSGAPWSLNSTVLWARCPALRDLITSFWEEGGGALELSIRACGAVLACLCRYIHSGVVFLPRGLGRRLQLLRVAAELRMDALHEAVLRDVVRHRLRPDTCGRIARFAAENELAALLAACEEFDSSGRVEGVPGVEFTVSGAAGGERSDPMSLQSIAELGGASNASLRDAIFASLQDVAHAVGEGASSSAGALSKELLLRAAASAHGRPSAELDWPSPAWEDPVDSWRALPQSPEGRRGGSTRDASFAPAEGRVESRSVGAKGSPSPLKSGGIYGLLLKAQDSGRPQVRQGDSQRGGASKPRAASARTQPQSLPTPRTQRATALLAGARPASAEWGMPATSDRGATTESDSDESDAAAIASYMRRLQSGPSDGPQETADSGGLGDAELCEYSSSMSLAPVREPTAAELRLINMAQPRKPLPRKASSSSSRARGAAKPAVDDSLEMAVTTSSSPEASVSASAVQSLQPKRAQSPLSARQLGEKDLAAEARKRQQSSLSSGGGGSTSVHDLHLVRPSGESVVQTAAEAATASSDSRGVLDPSVRGSLALLKTKGMRRRRSVAELDKPPADRDSGGDTQQQPTPPAIATLVPSRPTPSTTNPSLHHVQQQRPQFDADPSAGSAADEPEALTKCAECGRCFNPAALERHAKVCANVFQSKRKPFDSSKMRQEAIAALNDVQQQSQPAKRNGTKASDRPQSAAPTRPKQQVAASTVSAAAASAAAAAAVPKWKEDSNKLRDAMKAARDYRKAVESGAPLPPPVLSAPDPSLIPCPHCNRRFNEKAAERHIPQCKNIRAKPTSLKSGTGVKASSSANTNASASSGYGGFGSGSKGKKW